MQNNYSFSPIIGFLVFVVLGSVILAVGAAGTYGPEQQAMANRMNAEVDYLRGKYAQELAASQAEIDAAIANAPVVAQLELDRQAAELAQQRQDFKLNANIKEAIPFGILALTTAAAVIAAAYAATRATGSITASHTPAGSTAGHHQPQRSTNPPRRTLESSNRTGLRPRPARSRPTVQPPSANGQGDPRWREYRQLIEQNHAATDLITQRMAAVENRLLTLEQQLTDTKGAVQQGIGEIRTSQAALVKQLTDLPTVLQRHQNTVHTNTAAPAQNNGQAWHAPDGRESDPSTGNHNGTGNVNKEANNPNTLLWRKAA